MEETDLQKKAGQGLHEKNVGIVTAIRGSIIDIEFNENLPPINSVIRTGNKTEIILEVQMQPDANHVRCMALTPTQGLSRGMKATTSNEPLKVPVGKETLGHVFDVFGNPSDGYVLPASLEWRSIHQSPPSLIQLSTTSEIFETGIKAIDVLTPLDAVAKRVYLEERELAKPASAKQY